MAVKPKTDNSAYTKLKKDLSAGTLGRLYVFHGEEAYLRDYYLGRMKEQLVGQGMAEFNLHTINGKDFTTHGLEEAVDCLPMMSDRTLILVTDYDLFKAGEKDREELIRILAQLPDYCCLVFLYDLIAYKADARTKLSAALKEHGSVVQFARQEQGDLVDWIRRRFHALGKDIDTEQARYLIFRCGDLMNNLIGEIEKVGAYARGARITKEDIDAVATAQLDAVVFQMTDAIGAGNFDQASLVLGELFQMQEPPIRILFSLGKQIRQLYAARLALENHRNAGDLARQWGLSPYPAEKLMNSARRFSLAWCRKGVAACAKTDLALKSGGGADKQLLTDLLLELATPARKK